MVAHYYRGINFVKDPPRRETNRLQILVFDHYHQMNTPDIQYVLLTNPNGTEQVCFNRNISHSEAVWVENSVESTLPAFVLQFAVILAVNRLFLILSELFHVPRIVANIFVSIHILLKIKPLMIIILIGMVLNCSRPQPQLLSHQY